LVVEAAGGVEAVSNLGVVVRRTGQPTVRDVGVDREVDRDEDRRPDEEPDCVVRQGDRTEREDAGTLNRGPARSCVRSQTSSLESVQGVQTPTNQLRSTRSTTPRP